MGTPIDALSVLKDGWKSFTDQRAQTPASVSSAGSRSATGARIPAGWRLRRGRWKLRAPGTLSIRPLTASALSEHEAAQQHGPLCRCEQCFGSLDVPRPDSAPGERSRALRGQRDQLAVLPTVLESAPDRSEGLAPTERYVRSKTLPMEHALADGPAPAHRPVEKTSRRQVAERGITLEDLPHVDFESWEEKWGRELKFLQLEREREDVLRVATQRVFTNEPTRALR